MKLIFGADIVPIDESEKLFINGEVEKLFSNVLPIMKGADRVIINLECALTKYDKGIAKCGPCIKADPACAFALAKAGVTDVALSNNHVFDFGIKGLRDTMDSLTKAGIPYMGIGENDTDSRKIYYIEGEGKKIGIVNVCEHEYSYAQPHRIGANPFDPYLTMEDIREAKKNSDYVIVIYHGGKENTRYPSPRLRRACREMVNNGASVVLTQHSHCIGSYEEFRGGHILYGQGNFHFAGISNTEMWRTAFLTEVTITDSLQVRFIPIVLNGTQVSLASGELKNSIMIDFDKRNKELQTDEWIKGWQDFCKSVTYYDTYVGKFTDPNATPLEKESFPHYILCEAHLDVLLEKFPTWNKTNEMNIE